MNILIAGCGYVGSRAAQQLIPQGHRVTGLKRNPVENQNSMTWVQGDLTQETMDDLPFSPDILILAAGLRRDTDKNYENLFVHGYGWLINELKSHHSLRRIVMVSTTSVFAENEGGIVSEESPTNDHKSPAKYYLAAEQLLAESGISSSVLRMSGIYGPGRTRLINEVREGRAICHPEKHYLNHIHADDAASSVVHAALHKAPAPLYVASDRDPADRSDVLQWIADQLGLGNIPRAESKEPVLRRSGNKRCSSDLLIESGFSFRYPTYREGYADLL